MKKCWLDNKTAIVTGASGGMGAGIAKTLITTHGCTVIGIARSEKNMLSFVEELGEEHRDKFSYKLFDVSSKENWESFAKELSENNIKVDILINNAGILPRFARFEKYSDDEIASAMNINFYSAVYSIKAMLPILMESSDPAIVNIDSAAALMTLPGTSIYSASKAALKSFTEALRLEYKGRMYVGLVCPGFTKTNIFRNQKSNDTQRSRKIMNMVSTDCDKMVRKIMRGIRRRKKLQVHGFDAHSMSIANRAMPVEGQELFSGVMKVSKFDLFNDVFN
ncbi:MAG: SDR family NAD(P)-dependent oxidoreductase [Eubacterium sp.]|jgi:short-subunit dehydrogenase|nr:SDR family NAD(P)-dependent oxidoreductase [Eubacterium sp.]